MIIDVLPLNDYIKTSFNMPNLKTFFIFNNDEGGGETLNNIESCDTLNTMETWDTPNNIETWDPLNNMNTGDTLNNMES